MRNFAAFGFVLILSVSGMSALAQQTECPNTVDYVNTGLALVREGDYITAIDMFTCALEWNSDNNDALVARMEAAILAAEYQRAIIDANEHKEREPELFETLLESYEATVRRNPRNTTARMDLILLNWVINNDAEVIQQASELIDIDPDNVFAFLMRGSSFQYQDDPLQAQADFQMALNLGGEDPDSYGIIGSSQVQSGDILNAFLALDRSIALNPDNPRAYYFRGVAGVLDGYLEDAIREFDQAIMLYPQYNDAVFDRAEAYEILGDYESALADYNGVINLHPDFAHIYSHRGTVYEFLANTTAATEDFARYIYDYVTIYLPAESLAPGITASGVIQANQAAVYTLFLQREATVEISVSSEGALNALAVLNNDRGEAISSSNNRSPGNRSPFIRITAPQPGAYVLLVTAADPHIAANGEFQVSVVEGQSSP